MILNSVSSVVAGLALLLFSMKLLTESLNREMVRHFGGSLQRISQSPMAALVTGFLATAVVQASSVTIIATMGFLSRGLITLDRSVLIVLGAALGSALKGWYTPQVSLVVGPILLVIGAYGIIAAKDRRRRQFFEALASMGITFLGFQLIESGLAPLSQTSFFRQFLEISVTDGAISVVKPVLVGLFLSLLLQSSSSVLLLVIHLCAQGSIASSAALGLLLGANIGTTSTPLFASLGFENTDAKRLAVSYSIIKMSGVALVLTFFRTHSALLEDLGFILRLDRRPDLLIAAFHIWFNLMNALTWWLLLPVLLKILTWMVPGGEVVAGTSPFTLKVQKLLGSLPGRALSEGVNKLQQVVRDLQWVSDSIFHIIDHRGDRKTYNDLLQEGMRKCDRSVEVLDTVRDVAWSYLQTSENSMESRRKILGLVLLTADLKNMECLLTSCIRALSAEGFSAVSKSHAIVKRFGMIRQQLNDSWEALYSIEQYHELAKEVDPDLYGKSEIDGYLFEMSLRLGKIHKLMNLNSMDNFPEVPAPEPLVTQVRVMANFSTPSSELTH